MTDDNWRERINDLPPLPDELDCEICKHKMRIASEDETPSKYIEDHLFKADELIPIPTKSRMYVCDNCYARVGKSSRLGEIVTNEMRNYMRKDT